jgi:quercetin dioxygenase-like cupin family protein
MSTPTTERRLENPKIGDVVTMVETSAESGGERTLLRVELQPGGGTPPHFHKTYAEHFTAVDSTVTVHVNGSDHDLAPGECAEAPAGSRHFFKNRTGEVIVFEVELRPGHAGFEKAGWIGYGLAVDNRTNGKGIPKNPLHLALLLDMSEMRLPGIYSVAEPLLKLLARIARSRGVDRELEQRYVPGSVSDE